MGLKEDLQGGDFYKFTSFTSAGEFVEGNIHLPESETSELVGVFDSYDKTYGHGVTIDKEAFDVFRFHPEHDPPLVYGRRGGPDGGPDVSAGFAISKGSREDGTEVFVVVTFVFPIVSAKAIPQLVKIMKSNFKTAPMEAPEVGGSGSS